MKAKKKSFGGIAILTAVAASLCCITPMLAFVAGIGGIASTFSWLEPFRPYLLGITAAVLAFAWYQKLKPSKEKNCDCEAEKTPFMQTKLFLTIVTVFAVLMLAFPFYSHVFYPNHQAQNIDSEQENLSTEVFQISGMTCASCEEHINQAINELDGIQSVEASFSSGQAKVCFDKTKTNTKELTETINATGYKVIM